MRIFVAGGGTGGHLYPGLAIARAVQRLRPEVQPFFIGAKRGIEPDILPGTGYPFHLLDAHPFYRSAPWNNWKTIRGLFASWRELAELFRREQPRLVVGTGGYAAVPALAYAATHGVNIVEWTGDAMPSLTARMFSPYAREVYLSFPESAKRMSVRSPDAAIDTGAPIEPPPDPRPSRASALGQWSFPADARVVLVYGGSQGSEAINKAVRAWIAAGLPPHVHLIWGTGRKMFDAYANLEGDRVRVRPYLAPVADAYAAADIAVARAGTSTIAELMAWQIPPILIPLPTSAANHQHLNAVALDASGAAIHLPQSEVSPARLTAAIQSVFGDSGRLERLRRATAARARPGAAADIAKRIVALLT